MNQDDKFSSIMEDIYAELSKFMDWLSSISESSDILMEKDEIRSELTLELVKGVRHYADKLEREALLAVIRKMFDNRISELRHRYYGTHRGLGQDSISIDESSDDEENTSEIIPSDANVEAAAESRLFVIEVRKRLSPNSALVMDTMLGGGNSDRLARLQRLSDIRSQFVFGKKKGIIRRSTLANAVVLPEQAVISAYAEIREAIREADNASRA